MEDSEPGDVERENSAPKRGTCGTSEVATTTSMHVREQESVEGQTGRDVLMEVTPDQTCGERIRVMELLDPDWCVPMEIPEENPTVTKEPQRERVKRGRAEIETPEEEDEERRKESLGNPGTNNPIMITSSPEPLEKRRESQSTQSNASPVQRQKSREGESQGKKSTAPQKEPPVPQQRPSPPLASPPLGLEWDKVLEELDEPPHQQRDLVRLWAHLVASLDLPDTAGRGKDISKLSQQETVDLLKTTRDSVMDVITGQVRTEAEVQKVADKRGWILEAARRAMNFRPFLQQRVTWPDWLEERGLGSLLMIVADHWNDLLNEARTEGTAAVERLKVPVCRGSGDGGGKQTVGVTQFLEWLQKAVGLLKERLRRKKEEEESERTERSRGRQRGKHIRSHSWSSEQWDNVIETALKNTQSRERSGGGSRSRRETGSRETSVRSQRRSSRVRRESRSGGDGEMDVRSAVTHPHPEAVSPQRGVATSGAPPKPGEVRTGTGSERPQNQQEQEEGGEHRGGREGEIEGPQIEREQLKTWGSLQDVSECSVGERGQEEVPEREGEAEWQGRHKQQEPLPQRERSVTRTQRTSVAFPVAAVAVPVLSQQNREPTAKRSAGKSGGNEAVRLLQHRQKAVERAAEMMAGTVAEKRKDSVQTTGEQQTRVEQPPEHVEEEMEITEVPETQIEEDRTAEERPEDDDKEGEEWEDLPDDPEDERAVERHHKGPGGEKRKNEKRQRAQGLRRERDDGEQHEGRERGRNEEMGRRNQRCVNEERSRSPLERDMEISRTEPLQTHAQNPPAKTREGSGRREESVTAGPSRVETGERTTGEGAGRGGEGESRTGTTKGFSYAQATRGGQGWRGGNVSYAQQQAQIRAELQIWEDDAFIQEFFKNAPEEIDPRQRYVIRMRSRGPNVEWFNRSWVMEELLRQKLKIPFEMLEGVSDLEGMSEIDVCFNDEKGYSLFWERCTVCQQQTPELFRDLVMMPLFKSEVKVLTIILRTTKIPAEDIEYWLKQRCKVLWKPQKKLDEWNVWTMQYKAIIALERDPNTETIRHLPKYFYMGADRATTRYSGQPPACYLCGGYDHKRVGCHVELCSKCGVRGHRSDRCHRPITCTLCREEGHSYRLCPQSEINKRYPSVYQREKERAQETKEREEWRRASAKTDEERQDTATEKQRGNKESESATTAGASREKSVETTTTKVVEKDTGAQRRAESNKSEEEAVRSETQFLNSKQRRKKKRAEDRERNSQSPKGKAPRDTLQTSNRYQVLQSQEDEEDVEGDTESSEEEEPMETQPTREEMEKEKAELEKRRRELLSKIQLAKSLREQRENPELLNLLVKVMTEEREIKERLEDLEVELERTASTESSRSSEPVPPIPTQRPPPQDPGGGGRGRGGGGRGGENNSTSSSPSSYHSTQNTAVSENYRKADKKQVQKTKQKNKRQEGQESRRGEQKK